MLKIKQQVILAALCVLTAALALYMRPNTMLSETRPVVLEKIIPAQKNESIGSELIANLAIVFSQMGERTLLIDADLRTPKQHTLFAVENRSGLCDVLAGRASFDQVVQSISGLLDLSVLTAGSLAPNPQELLSKDSMIKLVELVNTHFDVVLVDSSSASLSSDFQMLIHRLKGVVILAERNVSDIKKLQTLKENCLVAGGDILGCVLLDEQR